MPYSTHQPMMNARVLPQESHQDEADDEERGPARQQKGPVPRPRRGESRPKAEEHVSNGPHDSHAELLEGAREQAVAVQPDQPSGVDGPLHIAYGVDPARGHAWPVDDEDRHEVVAEDNVGRAHHQVLGDQHAQIARELLCHVLSKPRVVPRGPHLEQDRDAFDEEHDEHGGPAVVEESELVVRHRLCVQHLHAKPLAVDWQVQ
eukprot:scaffold69790_cov58-Phaeocystis_antarctica.AAC.2